MKKSNILEVIKEIEDHLTAAAALKESLRCEAVDAVTRYNTRGIEALCALVAKFIKWPNEKEREQISRRIQERSNFGDVAGFIDGCHALPQNTYMTPDLRLEKTTIGFINYEPETDAHGYAESKDEMDFESTAIEYGNIEMIVKFDDMKEAENERMIEAVNCISEEIQVLSIRNIKRYKKYGQDQIERFIRLKQEEGLSIPKAAAQCGIPRSTTYELINEFNSSDGVSNSQGYFTYWINKFNEAVREFHPELPIKKTPYDSNVWEQKYIELETLRETSQT
ncbi:hypothetical protein INT45_003262 [Circinella minor]|uniref:Uncharacterized protein n=1 Tax=Circinella minor TaxID=1195481 RepID=A0A8H7S949_9FUNG|nr:hypothetical protein INT45_003262 [Circinella minor]